jgi:hypothetical protein
MSFSNSPGIPCRTVGELRAALETLPADTPLEPTESDYLMIFHPCSLHAGVLLDGCNSYTPGRDGK